MRSRDKLRRALAIGREGRIVTLWFKLLEATVYRRLLFYERVLGDPPEHESRLPLQPELLAADQIDAYLAFRGSGDEQEIRRRLDAGELCFALWSAGRLIHTCWAAVGTGWIGYLGCSLPLRPDEVYVYDAFTDPESRVRGVSRARSVWMERFLRERGYRRWLFATLAENRLGVRFIVERAGNRPLGTIGCVRIGSRRLGLAWRPGRRIPRLFAAASPQKFAEQLRASLEEGEDGEGVAVRGRGAAGAGR